MNSILKAMRLATIALIVILNACATEPMGSSDKILVTGTATYRQRIAMPPEAILNVQVEDVSRADAASQILAEIKEPLGDRQVPIAFSLEVPKSAIQPNHRYNLRAAITENDKLRFITTRQTPVLTAGAANNVNVLMDAVNYPPSTQETPTTKEMFQSREWQGEFRYKADAAIFFDCKSHKSWPIAMAGDYLAVEKEYQKSRNITGAPLLIRFTGKVENRLDAEAKTREHLLIETFHDAIPGSTCARLSKGKSLSVAHLKNTYWQLKEIDAQPIPAARSFRKQVRITLTSADSRLIGFNGCNQVAGRYTESGKALHFSHMATTKMACIEPYSGLERQVMTMLNATNAYRIEGEELFLLKGEQVLGRFESLYLK